jgi:hypothetical protein
MGFPMVEKIEAQFAPAAGKPENVKSHGFWMSASPSRAPKAEITRSSGSTVSEKHPSACRTARSSDISATGRREGMAAPQAVCDARKPLLNLYISV